MKRKYLLFCIPVVLGILIFAAGWFLKGSDGKGQSGKLDFQPFQNIDMEVISADITLVEGDSYSVEYRLHGREEVKRAEVVDGTLYFDTGFDYSWKPGRGSWQVVITVPADVNFGSVNLKSTAGDIHLSGRIVETLNMDTVSGALSLSDNQISDRAVLKTVSGNIESTGTPFNSIQAKSVGKITYNGADQGRELSLDEGNPRIEAESVSGKINIETK